MKGGKPFILKSDSLRIFCPYAKGGVKGGGCFYTSPREKRQCWNRTNEEAAGYTITVL